MPAQPVTDPGAEGRIALRAGEVVFGTMGGEPPLDFWAYLPRRTATRILVSVHGISESARSHAEHFAPLAERHGSLLVAPHFERPAWRDYQRLGRPGRGPRADRALERLVAAVGARAGVGSGRFFLFGYSGGGQFAHRYLMAHPRRVAAAAVASAGWYTFPDTRRRFPHGIRRGASFGDLELDADVFLRVPLLVTVGERDVERDGSLRQTERIDREQGLNRLERARRFVAAMRRAAERRGMPSPVVLRPLPGAGHSFEENVADADLARLVCTHFFGFGPPPTASRPESSVAGRGGSGTRRPTT